jgi:beta-lactamase class D
MKRTCYHARMRTSLHATVIAASLAAGLAACTPPDQPYAGDVAASTNPVGAAADVAPADTVERDLAHLFGDIPGAMVVFDAGADQLVRHNPARAGQGFLPASTFKIPNTLIALETGVASGPEFQLAWDSTRAPRQAWWPASWAQDHTLRSALPASAVWYYQELARRIGTDRMTTHLQRFEYGDANVGGGIDQFWLTGDLRISADEQVRFLRRFVGDALAASPENTALTRELLLLDKGDDFRLYGKTGWAMFDDNTPDVGWLVGWLERDDLVHVYALNMEIRRNEDAGRRLPIVRAALAELGLLPPAAAAR